MSTQRYEIQGRTVTLPCIVRDASSGNVLYFVPAEAAQQLVPGEAFEVVEAAPGQTNLTLGIVDYRDNDLGDYLEAVISFMVKPKGAPDAAGGTFIYKLPVDQSFTCEAGNRIWGFPKSVEAISVDYADHQVVARLDMNGQHVFTLTVPRADPEGPSDELDTFTYTYIDGIAHKTSFATGGARALNPGGVGAAVELGDHPIAHELRSLNLESTSPLLSVWIPNMTGRFGPAVKLD